MHYGLFSHLSLLKGTLREPTFYVIFSRSNPIKENRKSVFVETAANKGDRILVEKTTEMTVDISIELTNKDDSISLELRTHLGQEHDDECDGGA